MIFCRVGTFQVENVFVKNFWESFLIVAELFQKCFEKIFQDFLEIIFETFSKYFINKAFKIENKFLVQFQKFN